MTKTTQETGRSLVETLSVLAIMGLLSVASLTGYTLAMNKHRANELLNDLMQRATVISAQRQSGQDPTTIEGETMGGYPVEGIVTPNSEQFAITVEDVPQEVCEKIVALDLQNATVTPAECPDEKNDMTFTYNNDLSPITDSNAGGSTGGNEGDESEELPPDTTPVCDAEHLDLCENISDCEDIAQGKWCDDTSTCISSGGVCQPVCDAEHLNLCENISDCEEKAKGKWCDGTSTCISSGGVCQCSTEPNVCQKCDETGAIIADKNGEECATGKHCFDGNCSSFVGYCRRTDSNAECIEWDECEEGKVHTGNEIQNIPNAQAICAKEEYIYCRETNSNGNCRYWEDCEEGKVHTGNEILNIPNAEATCGKAEDIFCRNTNSDGNCTQWEFCPGGRAHSGWEIIDVPNGIGECAAKGASVYCYEFSLSANKCRIWGECSGTAVDATSSDINGGECQE